MIYDLILKWHQDVGLMGKKTTQLKRSAKLQSELGELADALLEGTTDDCIMELGDMLVVMVGIAHKLGVDLDECAFRAYMKIKNRTGKMVDGTFVKDKPCHHQ